MIWKFWNEHSWMEKFHLQLYFRFVSFFFSYFTLQRQHQMKNMIQNYQLKKYCSNFFFPLFLGFGCIFPFPFTHLILSLFKFKLNTIIGVKYSLLLSFHSKRESKWIWNKKNKKLWNERSEKKNNFEIA